MAKLTKDLRKTLKHYNQTVDALKRLDRKGRVYLFVADENSDGYADVPIDSGRAVALLEEQQRTLRGRLHTLGFEVWAGRRDDLG